MVANLFELLFLDNPQEFYLHRCGHVSDLVEKNASLMSDLEPTLAVFDSASKRSAHMAEKFAFEEKFVQSCAIYFYKGALVPAAKFVYRFSHELLACAAFS